MSDGDMQDWVAGPIVVSELNGRKEVIPGWLRYPFGIDTAFFVNELSLTPILVIHHLPTGYSVCAVDGKTEQAVECCDILLSMGSWDFTDHDDVHKYAGAKKILIDAGLPVCDPSGAMRPHRPPTHSCGARSRLSNLRRAFYALWNWFRGPRDVCPLCGEPTTPETAVGFYCSEECWRDAGI